MNKGRPNKPKDQKLLEGTYRKDRDTGGLVLPKLSQIPKAPEYMNDLQKEYFKNICLTLKEYEILTGADIYLVAMLAENLAIKQDTLKQINDAGEAVQQTQNGYTTISGYFSVYDKVNKKIMELSNLFGLSPSARERIKMQPQKEEDEIDKLIK